MWNDTALLPRSFIIHEVNDVPSMFGAYDAITDLLFDEEFPGGQYKKVST